MFYPGSQLLQCWRRRNLVLTVWAVLVVSNKAANAIDSFVADERGIPGADRLAAVARPGSVASTRAWDQSIDFPS